MRLGKYAYLPATPRSPPLEKLSALPQQGESSRPPLGCCWTLQAKTPRCRLTIRLAVPSSVSNFLQPPIPAQYPSIQPEIVVQRLRKSGKHDRYVQESDSIDQPYGAFERLVSTVDKQSFLDRGLRRRRKGGHPGRHLPRCWMKLE